VASPKEEEKADKEEVYWSGSDYTRDDIICPVEQAAMTKNDVARIIQPCSSINV
jgi:hypothetical protein